jgi:hypothetical protein
MPPGNDLVCDVDDLIPEIKRNVSPVALNFGRQLESPIAEALCLAEPLFRGLDQSDVQRVIKRYLAAVRFQPYCEAKMHISRIGIASALNSCLIGQ